MLGLHGCADFPLVAERGGRSPVAVCEPLAGAASAVGEHGLQGTLPSAAAAHGLSSGGSRAMEHRLSSCGARVQPLHGVWDPPRPGPEPMSAAMAGGFFTTREAQQVKNSVLIFFSWGTCDSKWFPNLVVICISSVDYTVHINC